LVVFNRDNNQQGQPSDITININNHINFYSSPQTPLDNHDQSTTMDGDNGNQEGEEEEEEDSDEDDDKTITGNESDDSDGNNNYHTPPPTSDDDCGNEKLDLL
jgi:hypothetical protein